MTFKLPEAVSLGTLLKKKLPEARPIIAPWLHSGESCLLWAGTGVGKSMIAQTLALGVAGGGSALGWKFPNPSRVLYVDGEQSERALQNRFGFLGTAVEGFDAAKASKNLTVMARATQVTPSGFLDIANEEQHSAFLNYAKESSFALVVFDNLSTLSDKIEDENSAAALKPMQSLLTHLKRLNVAVILVHHSGKDPNKFRGSSGIATTFERILGVRRNETAPATKIDATVTLEKFRDEVPEGFRPLFPLTFSTEVRAGARCAVWNVGDLMQLEEAWRDYAHGSHETQEAFVRAFNARNGTHHKPGNFGRDFAAKWMTTLGKTEAEIKAAKRRMEALRRMNQGEESEGVPADF